MVVDAVDDDAVVGVVDVVGIDFNAYVLFGVVCHE